MMKKPLYIIAGPTAAGKSALAVELAKKYGTDESPAFINGVLAKMI